MLPDYVTQEKLTQFISSAFSEDVGDGDHTSLASIPEDARKKAHLLIKDPGVIAGIELAQHIFNFIDPDLEIEIMKKDGEEVEPGEIAFTVEGSARNILTAERLVLNCMQRMSGIATYTHELMEMIEGTGTRLLDTRKTTPNFRMLEKWAVLIGGGVNHRHGLYDMIMIKDNHVDFAGSITKAVNSTLAYLQEHDKSLQIEVEVRNLKEVEEALQTGKIDRILLDNMTPEEMKEAVNFIKGKVDTEASGGITDETIREVAETGVDFISIGALTHSIKSLDMSLKAVD